MGLDYRVLPINGLEMNVLVADEGEPLLLLHGFPDSSKLWRNMVPRLTDAGYRVIAPDQRGFGNTDAPPHKHDYTIQRIAADAIAVLDTLGIERAALMGHDWGAAIGWWLAGSYPDRFTCFVALSVGHPKAVQRAGLRQKLKSWYFLLFLLPGIGEAVVRAFNFAAFKLMTRGDPEIVNWRRDLARPGRLTAAMNWYRANLKTMSDGAFPPARVPVLGLVGSDDVALGTEQMARSREYVDAAFDFAVIDGAGHWMPLSAPEQLGARLLPFLARHG